MGFLATSELTSSASGLPLTVWPRPWPPPLLRPELPPWPWPWLLLWMLLWLLLVLPPTAASTAFSCVRSTNQTRRSSYPPPRNPVGFVAKLDQLMPFQS